MRFDNFGGKGKRNGKPFFYIRAMRIRWHNILLSILVVWLLSGCFQSVCARDRNKNADDLIGTYSAFDRKLQTTVHLNFYKADDGTYQARIVWLEQPDDDLGKPKTDVNNPRSEFRHIPLTHVVVVRDLRYDTRKNEWEGGKIYDPASGKTYRCFIRFEDENTLRVKAYVGIIGFRFLGRSFYWTSIS